MDPNQTIGKTPSRVDKVDPIGSHSRTETLRTGRTGTDGTTGTAQTQRIPPIGTSNQDRPSSHDRSSPPDRTLIPDQTSIPDRTGARVWNRPGERQAAGDQTRPQSARPISSTPLTQTREEVTELRGMVSSLIDETRCQKAAYRTIANRLDQAERTQRSRALDLGATWERTRNDLRSGHAPAKLKLQRAGRNRYRATRSTKHSDSITKQIYKKT
ncbi:hypothetical protein DY000_02020625 [Brassica cretica]|uniref:Uncharacterized protein n=1 Tax=Brassica cretica TaxID=69181 RepID=A0ABQ7EBP2_BRACR|nr:hypothetical protein DY000_02020625 [Brassica cretica]